ncbi:chemotaxis protein [Streptomyces sp. MAR4 CNX-425]|uniref:baeRF3 domain-containing protein n=1 Tax=Streptomyces sp. MAR4 CNX-425 TaxID=3406343 RepID=UPI003B5035CF
MHTSLTPTALAELREPRPYPAVSLTLPTDRRAPRNAEDSVRLRNVLAEAERRLDRDPGVTRAARDAIRAQLTAAVDETDLARALDGLVVLAAADEQHVYALPRAVPERVVLSETFLTRNLVAAYAAQRPYWVLSLAADRVTLWSGSGRHVTEATAGGFPMTRSPDNTDTEREERIGDTPSTFRDEEVRHFLRDADAALHSVLRQDPRPLYVTGEDAALSLLADAGTATATAVHIPHGGLAQGPPEAVVRAVAPARAAQGRRETEEAVGALDEARGRRAFAGGVDEVWAKVSDGRIHRLVVEENYRVTVRSADDDHLVPAEDDDPRARPDIVDEIVEKALDTGAQVVFVPDDALADHDRIAAVLRY